MTRFLEMRVSILKFGFKAFCSLGGRPFYLQAMVLQYSAVFHKAGLWFRYHKSLFFWNFEVVCCGNYLRFAQTGILPDLVREGNILDSC